MKSLPSSALVDLVIDIAWENNGIAHQEHYFVKDLNCWRDAIPGSPVEKLMKSGLSPFSMQVNQGTLVPSYDPARVVRVPLSRLNGHGLENFRAGRFYPQGILSGIPGIFKANMSPFRCVSVDEKGITADLNHPMARFSFSLSLGIENRSMKSEERGGACRDVMEEALTGPGMQVMYGSDSTSFSVPGAFERKDETPDPAFYTKDRLVRHIDEKASANLSQIYREMIPPGSRVLDLMAGYESHLPDGLELKQVHGLGLNENELKANRQLDAYTIQDLNTDPHLKFADKYFDAVICSLSVEYLVDPVPVFNEAARVLKNGGKFIVAFSNRWFPEKNIRIWEDLHDFERMGLVIEYFRQANGFGALSTRSVRGYPRPFTDRYFPRFRQSDPVFTVAGQKVSR